MGNLVSNPSMIMVLCQKLLQTDALQGASLSGLILALGNIGHHGSEIRHKGTLGKRLQTAFLAVRFIGIEQFRRTDFIISTHFAAFLHEGQDGVTLLTVLLQFQFIDLGFRESVIIVHQTL